MTNGTYTGAYSVISNPTAVSITIGTTASVIGTNSPASVYANVARTVTNFGKVSNTASRGVDLTKGGTVINGSHSNTTASIEGNSFGVSLLGTTGGTVTNYGLIESTYRNISGPFGYTNADSYHTGKVGFDGVYLHSGGQVTNSGMAANIYGYAGVQSAGGSLSVTNTGTIAGYSEGIAVLKGSTGLSLNNSGLIHSRVNEAVEAYSGAVTITNTGTILAAGTVNVYVSFASASNRYPGGIYVGGGVAAGAKITNGGTANSTALIAGYSYGIRVYSPNGATITNWGTIKGTGNKYFNGTVSITTHQYAIDFGSSGSAPDRLIDEAGSTFIGVVKGAGVNSVVELASSTSAGTMMAAGGQFTNFSALIIDSGARWTVNGDGGLASEFTNISGFTIGDTIALTGLAQTPTTFASNVATISGTVQTSVTISAGATGLETLTLLGSIAPAHLSFVAGATSTLAFVNPPPTIVAGGTVTFDGGGAPVTMDAGLTVTDPSSSTLNSATISIGAEFLSSDTLIVGTPGGLATLYNNGQLFLIGTASLGTYETALESVEFASSPANSDPTGGGGDTFRTIEWSVNDGIQNSGTVTSRVDTVHVAASVTAGATVAYAGDGLNPPVVLDSGLTVTDPDSGGNLIGAAVTISSGFTTGDALNFSPQNGITETGFINGTLTLAGTATVADYQAALASVTYSSSLTDPTVGETDTSRTISWTAKDDAGTSNIATSLVDVTPCYCRGTRIMTHRGEITVEDLTIGDLVLTVDGAVRPIRWIGHRTIDLTRHRAPGQVRPILIRADAIADGAPVRDLRVSPDHALLVDGVLIMARQLVNGASIERDVCCTSVTYYHVELETHDILLAEGLPAESYLDTGNRGMFENAGAPLILHPDFDDGHQQRVALSCRPFADAAATVEPYWRRLAVRAILLGLCLPEEPETTSDPALHIVVDGRVIEPILVNARCHTFVLPRADGPVRLVSRAVRPSDARPWVEDRRRLGVAVSQLTLKRGTNVEPIPLDHPSMSAGWWDVERDHDTHWRWTDGDAVLAFSGVGPAVLEITLADTLDYVVEQDVGAVTEPADDHFPAPALAA
jgi:collagen type I/II/III/V/XI/XXIV/XXVII alpha